MGCMYVKLQLAAQLVDLFGYNANGLCVKHDLHQLKYYAVGILYPTSRARSYITAATAYGPFRKMIIAPTLAYQTACAATMEERL